MRRLQLKTTAKSLRSKGEQRRTSEKILHSSSSAHPDGSRLMNV